MKKIAITERAQRRNAISEAHAHLIELASKRPMQLIDSFHKNPSLVGDLACLEEVLEILVDGGFTHDLLNLREVTGIGRYTSGLIAQVVLFRPVGA